MRNKREHIRRAVVLILAVAGLITCTAPFSASSGLASAQAAAPNWSYTGSLNTARLFHTTTLLANGKVLVAGGCNDAGCLGLDSAELYDPVTGTWGLTGGPNVDRVEHSATLLPNGKVLVAGGFNRGVVGSAELYDPVAGTWSFTGNLNVARADHTATLLPNGKVLVAGGTGTGIERDEQPWRSAELYDPATGTWSVTGNLNTGRLWGHTQTLLPNGKVLVAGGTQNSEWSFYNLSSSELYDPNTGTWSLTGSLNVARFGLTATLLPNGNVLVTGGESQDGAINNSAELYNPTTETWSYTGSLSTGRYGHTATLLPNGKVLVAGGHDWHTNTYLDSADVYDPATGNWSGTAKLNVTRMRHTAVLLQSGKVLVVGGCGLGSPLSAELYDSGSSSTINPIDDAQFFVRQHYLDFLNREPDAGGLAYWTNRITECGSDARCIHERRIGVSAAFFVEQEFQDTGYYVYRFYKASFGRQPNYAEFTADRAKVIGGSNLEANKQAFADEWVQRQSFRDAYPITMSNTEVVNKLFDSAGLTASLYDAQRQQEILAMNAGRSRALVLRDVIEIPDFKNIPDPNDPRYSELKQISQYNPAFVLMQYFGYLRRNVDQDGYDFWLDVVNNREPNNYRGMVCAFITSTEYQLRFGSAVTRSNADCGQ